MADICCNSNVFWVTHLCTLLYNCFMLYSIQNAALRTTMDSIYACLLERSNMHKSRIPNHMNKSMRLWLHWLVYAPIATIEKSMFGYCLKFFDGNGFFLWEEKLEEEIAAFVAQIKRNLFCVFGFVCIRFVSFRSLLTLCNVRHICLQKQWKWIC